MVTNSTSTALLDGLRSGATLVDERVARMRKQDEREREHVAGVGGRMREPLMREPNGGDRGVEGLMSDR